jgi:hypothetical protein
MMLMATYCDNDDSVDVNRDGYGYVDDSANGGIDDMLRMITLLIETAMITAPSLMLMNEEELAVLVRVDEPSSTSNPKREK